MDRIFRGTALVLLISGATACSQSPPTPSPSPTPAPSPAPSVPESALAPPSDYWEDPACETIDNSFRCARAVEALRLADDPRVTRHGDTLRVPSASGHAVEIVDQVGIVEQEFDGGEMHFSYLGMLPASDLRVFHIQFYEGDGYAVMPPDLSQIHRVYGNPRESQDGRWLLSSESGYYSLSGIYLHRVGANTVTLEWSREEFDGWMPGEVRWVDPETAVVTRLSGDPEWEEQEVVGEFVLRLVDGEWVGEVREYDDFDVQSLVLYGLGSQR